MTAVTGSCPDGPLFSTPLKVGGTIEHLYDVGTGDPSRLDLTSEPVTPPVETVTMARQLTLIETSATWRLDEQTREVGRRGIASARAELAAHRPADPDERTRAA